MNLIKLLIFKCLFVIRKRKRLLISLLILLIITIVLNSNKISHHLKCKQMKSEAIAEICDSFDSKQFVGSLCHPLCVQRTLHLTDCPNMEGHDGKDYVFISHLLDAGNGSLVEKIVLKARSLTTFELIGNNVWKEYFKNNKQLIIKSINQLMTERFDQRSDNQSDYHFIGPLLSQSLTNAEQLNETSLVNLWLLIQDNEYVLSRFYPQIFPPIIGTCGHFYGVRMAEPILDLSYFTPLFLFKSQSLKNRIEVGIKVMQFLLDFQTIEPKIELCDIKFEHLGFIEDNLSLIDSDMIYSKKSAINSIESLSSCQQNSDCDFIDCKGVCNKNKCSIDDSDDDLKRICRNIFFMGKLYGFVELGLFCVQTDDEKLKNSFELIRKYCFQRSNLLSDAKSIVNILTHILT